MWEIPGYFAPRNDIVGAETDKVGLLKLLLMYDRLAAASIIAGWRIWAPSRFFEVGGLWARLGL